MAAANSTSIVRLHIGGFSFRVKLRNMVKELKTSHRAVCAKHEVRISYFHVCRDCHHPITESVLGAPGEPPMKVTKCTNGRCGADTSANVTSLAFCAECSQIIGEDGIARATVFGDDEFVMTKDQRDGIYRLKLPERSIVVKRALARNQVPSMRYVRGVQAVVPTDKAFDQLAFQLMRTAARKQDLSFACHTAVKFSESSTAFEHGALLQFDPDGSVLLVLLHAEHEVQTQPVAETDTPIELQQHMAKTQTALVDQIAPVEWPPLLSTPAVRAFHGLLLSDDRRGYKVPEPDKPKDEVNALAKTLQDAMKVHLPPEKAKKGEDALAESVADESNEAAEAVASVPGSETDTTITSDTN